MVRISTKRVICDLIKKSNFVCQNPILRRKFFWFKFCRIEWIIGNADLMKSHTVDF